MFPPTISKDRFLNDYMRFRERKKAAYWDTKLFQFERHERIKAKAAKNGTRMKSKHRGHHC